MSLTKDFSLHIPTEAPRIKVSLYGVDYDINSILEDRKDLLRIKETFSELLVDMEKSLKFFSRPDITSVQFPGERGNYRQEWADSRIHELQYGIKLIKKGLGI